jgi:hypothetical protein
MVSSATVAKEAFRVEAKGFTQLLLTVDATGENRATACPLMPLLLLKAAAETTAPILCIFATV